MQKKTFSIIGGDLRNVKLANLLQSDGNKVYIYGFKNLQSELPIENSNDIVDIINKSDIVIGPIPCSNDGETLNCPFHENKINISEVFKYMNRTQLFMAGRINEKISNLAQIFNVHHIDLLEREELSILNSIPTAEGAIQIAMEEMPTTLHGSNALVLGFGRIGKTLSKMLLGIGCNTYVEARKYEDIAWIKSYGYAPVFINDLIKFTSKMDIIFSTVPSLILTENILKTIKKDTLIIDLASKPGGIDFEKAKEMGIKFIWALSLPGKVAPITTAEFIKDTINNIITEVGV